MPNVSQTGAFTMVAGEALEKYRRVKMYGNDVGSREVVYADAGEDFVGITQEKAAINESVTVLQVGNGTFLCESAGAITAEATIYGAADGKIDDVVSGDPIGTALELAGAAGVLVECVPLKTSTVAELDGVTAGTVTASKAVVVDANKDVASFRDVTVRDLKTADGGGVTFGADGDVEIEHNGTDGLVIGKTSAQKLAFFGGTPAVQPTHIGDPAQAVEMTATLAGVDTATDMTAAQAATIVADLLALKTAVDANNTAIDSILAQLAALGLQANA